MAYGTRYGTAMRRGEKDGSGYWWYCPACQAQSWVAGQGRRTEWCSACAEREAREIEARSAPGTVPATTPTAEDLDFSVVGVARRGGW